jgi:hypothetical protein
MATGILLSNCVDVRLDNISMNGMDNAFEIYDSDDIKMNDIDLRATRTAVKGERIRRLTAKSVTHSEEGWLPCVTPLAMAVRRIAHGDV